MTDYCTCDKSVPIDWFDICTVCGKKTSIGVRPVTTHPKPFKEAEDILRKEVDREQKLWGHWGTYNNNIWRDIFHTLLDMEFFQLHKGYFLMSSHGIFLNPRLYGMIELYFTHKNGAELWRELEYGGAWYRVDICLKE